MPQELSWRRLGVTGKHPEVALAQPCWLWALVPASLSCRTPS